MKQQDIKHALISLLIGAIVSFLLTVFQGLLQILQTHATDFIGGASATITYLIKTHES